MPYRILWVTIMATLFSILSIPAGYANDQIIFQYEFPYSLGTTKEFVVPGETVQAMVVVENHGSNEQNVPVALELPACFAPIGKYEDWKIVSLTDQTIFSNSIHLSGGYGQWFDLLQLQVLPDVTPGRYPVKITVNGDVQEFMVKIVTRSDTEQALSIAGVVLPLDKDGRRDERLNDNTLVLRDRQLDYYKNVLQGKGAANLEIEAIHPVSHMAVDFINPGGQQKLLTITAQLLDQATHQPVAGLFTPGTTGEDKDAGAIEGYKECLQAFTALTGEARQHILLPVYADEQLVTGGKYLLQVVADDGLTQPMVVTVPLTIVKRNWQAMAVTCLAAATVLLALLWGLRYLRNLLSALKTRWLVTVALFGAAVFAVVNVPSTLLNDFFHVLLGPFGFLVTGLFSCVFLYMLEMSLVVLIPRPGIISLMTFIRMLLGMLVFGNISPVGVLSYGVHAFMLEILFYVFGIYGFFSKETNRIGLSVRQIITAAAVCGLAESIAIYVGIQSMAFLYRMYYADWFIYMIMLVNGLLYTTIGASCGLRLGCKLLKVGSD